MRATKTINGFPHYVYERLMSTPSKGAYYNCHTTTNEIQRMVALKRHNLNVRSEEIEALQAQGLALHEHLQAAGIRWDAVRLIVTL